MTISFKFYYLGNLILEGISAVNLMIEIQTHLKLKKYSKYAD